jgi:hypothetical protein
VNTHALIKKPLILEHMIYYNKTSGCFTLGMRLGEIMPRLTKVYWTLLSLLLLVSSASYPTSAAAGGVVIPPGFLKIDSTFGIDFYRKDYPGGSPDYVQVIDLSQGASLKPLHGSITDARAGMGSYGGNDARFRSLSLGAYWQELQGQDPAAFCVVNGQFFYMLEYPTRLPFPLKIDGQVLTDGYGIKDFPDQKLMLELWPGKADIVPLSKEALYTSNAPDIIAGLAEDAPKAKKRYTGRTFIGLTGANGEGSFDTLMVFNTKTARQVDAAEVMKSFGAQKVMMLDGGGSTQLICGGKSYIYSDRLVPQAIGIIAGDPAKAGLTSDLSGPQESTPTPAMESSGVSVDTPKTTPTPEPPKQADQSNSSNTNAPAQSQTQTIQQQPPSMTLPANTGGENRVGQSVNNPNPIAMHAQTMLPVLFSSAAIAQVPSGQSGLTHLENQVTGSPSQELAAPNTSTGDQLAREAPVNSAPTDQTLAAGVSPVHLDDALWVPASMAPIVLILLLGIFKLRRWES